MSVWLWWLVMIGSLVVLVAVAWLIERKKRD
jgi:hypothetical protein